VRERERERERVCVRTGANIGIVAPIASLSASVWGV
jgi:hypothetical protein